MNAARDGRQLNLVPHDGHPVIGIGKGLTSRDVIDSICDLSFKHIVQQDGLSFDRELRAACQMVNDPAAFFSNPLEVILADAADPVTVLRILSTADEKKQKVLTEFGKYLDSLRGTRAIVEQALMVADELYTNGAKNAWKVNGCIDKTAPARKGTLEFFAQAGDSRLVFGCRDSFGELKMTDVLERIRKCMELGVANAIRQGEGGAGIGSYMVFDACLSYYAGVTPGKESVVCVTMPLGLNRRTMAGLPKNIHLIA